ncbi:MAG: Asp-tRNA(Asn)/Glu-tRNA(Gln) amidotransferase subunit GatB [Candidatus Omnitrophica bacterium]|nr:Asp-tRNA(Asn)/Glu-tRNA(Gln) amidotransferase subunit GatB [Candidatus Omnitrophota bacterium]
MTPAGKYETTIGLEVHVQLATQSKIFCGCSTRFGSSPNSQACPVCLGFPGALPVMNKEALGFAIKVGVALGCEIAGRMKFDRKHYYYPDLPKNFQISQYDLPLAAEGSLELFGDGQRRVIRIKRVHLEEDAGKLIHAEKGDASLVDFNRSGMPLLEVVSEPDITSPEEAYEYLTEVKSILRYLDVSDCNMEEGSLRCDANISIRKTGAKSLGVKTELKNMNTFRGVKIALQYEIDRQKAVLEEGGKIIQETRLWNEAKARTFLMRTKEEAFDYRYFPEPDLVPFLIDRETVESIKASLPELPQKRYERFVENYKLQPALASIIVNERDLADFFEESAKGYPRNVQLIANWITGDIQGELNKRKLSMASLGLKPEAFADMLKLIDEGVITGKIAKGLLVDMIETGSMPRELVKSLGLSQITDKGALEAVMEKVIKNNPKPVEDYKNGKTNVITFLVGQVMRETKGKANPKIINEMLRERMGKL